MATTDTQWFARNSTGSPYFVSSSIKRWHPDNDKGGVDFAAS
jgi:hypothetical protein